MFGVNQKITTEARDGLVYIKSQSIESEDEEPEWRDEMSMKPNRAIQLARFLIKAAGNC